MSADTSSPRARRLFGPVHVLPRSLPQQLFGFLLAFIAVKIIDWAIDPHTVASATALYGAIGLFILGNGLYVGGVRLR